MFRTEQSVQCGSLSALEARVNLETAGVLIDPDDAHLITKYAWQVSPRGYVMRKGSYLHRDIMQPPEGYEVDHINGNGLDNRRQNLRLATHSQNLANRATGRDGEPRGVYKRYHRWKAQGRHMRRNYHLGTFQHKRNAARAYNCWALETFGEFARLNDTSIT